ncbi:hypothetical protein [Leptospira kanakyensis]|nr:hypothetical protein [Leptospira kanakyensis]
MPDVLDIEGLINLNEDVNWIQERLIDIIAAGVNRGLAKSFSS